MCHNSGLQLVGNSAMPCHAKPNHARVVCLLLQAFKYSYGKRTKADHRSTLAPDSCVQWRNKPKHLGGAIFVRERRDQARGSIATERGEGVGGPPSHGREPFHFLTWKCEIWGIPKKEISTWRHVLYHNHLYRIENKPWFNFILGGGGGASAPPSPPPVCQCLCATHCMIPMGHGSGFAFSRS